MSSGRRATFGKVAAAAAKLDVPKDVKLKDPKDWSLIGKASVPRFDLPDKVRGKPVYAIDVTLPGMLYASLAQCPVFGGSLKSVDSSAAEKMRVVQLRNAVAVVADNWWRANQAVKALKIEWGDAGKSGESSATILDYLKAGQAGANAPTARKESQNCTAWFRDEGGATRLDVWAPTQSGEASATAAAEAGGVPLANVFFTKMRRIRPARCLPGLRQIRRGDREDDAGNAGQDTMVARRGYAARLLSPDQPHAHEGEPRRVRTSDRVADDDRVFIDHRFARAIADEERRRHAGLRKLRRLAVRGAQPASGFLAAQHAPAGRLLAFGISLAESFLP